MPLGVIKCFTFEKSQYVLCVCLLYKAQLLSSLFSPYKKKKKEKKRQPFARSVSTASHQKTYSALTMQRVHLIDTAVISYLMTALSSPLFPSLHGR